MDGVDERTRTLCRSSQGAGVFPTPAHTGPKRPTWWLGLLHPRLAGTPQARGGLATGGLTAALLSPHSDSHLTERVLARSLSHL